MRALYYPYMNINDINWLKSTLLIFRQVKRLVPFPMRVPGDSEEIVAYQHLGGSEPLLAPANLFTQRVETAFFQIMRRIEHDVTDPVFVQRFSPEAGLPEFEIYAAKLHPAFRELLAATRLGWTPRTREPLDPYAEFVAVSEPVGQVIMATLGVASAISEGLDIVGNERSEPLHSCLIEKDLDAIYDTWLHAYPALDPPPPVAGSAVFEFFVARRCNLDALTPERLLEMREDREPIAHLMQRLQTLADGIPRMDDGPGRDRYFEDAVSDMLNEWRRDRRNMSNFWRNFWGEKTVENVGDFAGKVIEKAADGVAPTLSGATVAAITGHAAAAVPIAGAGLVIGMIVRGINTYADLGRRERESPYKWLTTMENAGVLIRCSM